MYYIYFLVFLTLKSKSFLPSFGLDGNSNSIPVNGNLRLTVLSSTVHLPWIGKVDDDIGILMYIVANPSITMVEACKKQRVHQNQNFRWECKRLFEKCNLLSFKREIQIVNWLKQKYHLILWKLKPAKALFRKYEFVYFV